MSATLDATRPAKRLVALFDGRNPPPADETTAWQPPADSPSRSRPLRPHQERALDELRQSLRRGKRRPMVQMPTGAGKTRFADEIIRGARDKGKRVAFCVPRKTLIDQTIREFEREGITAIGVMQARTSALTAASRSRFARFRRWPAANGPKSISSSSMKRMRPTRRSSRGSLSARTFRLSD